MNKIKSPTKEAVRAWFRQEVAARRPPPDMSAIRRELGWDLVVAERAKLKSGLK